jgi:hypothetical protein
MTLGGCQYSAAAIVARGSWLQSALVEGTLAVASLCLSVVIGCCSGR